MVGDLSSSSENNLIDWLRLIRTNHIGPNTFFQLLKKHGNAGKALEALPDIATKKRQFSPPSPEIIEQEITTAQKYGAVYIRHCDEAYPSVLKEIPSPPPVLCAAGDISLLHKDAYGIVGSRNASATGKKMTALLSSELGQAGKIVVSGLARGIDGVAHLNALPTGTIAVVAGGIDVIYPPEHSQLHAHIKQDGLILSEMPMGFKPRGQDFPRRNRIISGLSKGVIVVEAAKKSGSLITARYAMEQDRDVFAVPGSPLDPRCQGTNQLIRDGAALIESARDIIEASTSAPRRLPIDLFNHAEEEACLTPEGRDVEDVNAALLQTLSPTPMHKDDIIRNCSLSAAQINHGLVELVLAGEATENDGGYYSLNVG